MKTDQSGVSPISRKIPDKFRGMVYDKNYILSIDNHLTTKRMNQKYIMDYYSGNKDAVPKAHFSAPNSVKSFLEPQHPH